MSDKKLFLLDAYALIYRAYYALIRSPRVTSKGLNTSAVFGFVNTLDDLLRKENPTHIAVCFDPPGGHTFRHELYPEYKAQRDAQPEDITLSIPYIKEIIAAYNIPVIEMPQYEADDIIGTLARLAEAEGFTTYMMTPDKDYGQLVTEHTFMYRPALKGKDFEIRGIAEVCARYGIERPSQVIDLLALEGDASDNIPGCPGVGEKTAAKLIREFDNVDNLLLNTDKIKGALHDKIAANAEQIRFSRILATIKTDVPVTFDPESLRRRPEDVDRLRRVFTELEFKSFLVRLDSKSAPATQAPPVATAQLSLFDLVEPQAADVNAVAVPAASMPATTTIDDLGRAAEYVARACDAECVGLCVDATGDEAMTATLHGIALAIDPSQGVYFPLPDSPADLQQWMVMLQPLFDSPKCTLVSHDIKRDIVILNRCGVDISANYYDTSLAHYLLQPEMRHRIPDVAYAYLGLELPLQPDRTRRNTPDPSASAIQAAIVLALRSAFNPLLNDGGLNPLFNDIELPLARVLADMEMTGVRIDTDELNRLSTQLTARLHQMEHECFELAGHSFNISSPRQVGEVLFDELKIDPGAKRTKSGAYSTTEEILEKLRPEHPIVDLILNIRGLNKLLATYINALPTLINRSTGKIHTTYNQTVTATGRISSTNPNLQNIPIRTDDGREIRRAFIPDPGHLMLSADYSQIELRLMADLSADPDMVEAFLSGADIHRSTAAKIYDVPLEEVTDTMRRNAKTANFGIIYGISAFGLSQRLGIPRSEAKMLIDGYFNTYPHIRDYIDKAIANARDNGYVATIMGRKRFLPDINSRNAVVRSYAERNAVNAPLQGSAADIIKIAMVRIARKMSDMQMSSRMIMQVHDELIFDVVPDELPALQALVVSEMSGAYHGRVPLEVSAGVGANWLEAH